jgi:hypothetical protein
MAVRQFNRKSATLSSGDVVQTRPLVEDAARVQARLASFAAPCQRAQVSGRRVTSPSAKRAKRNGWRSTIGASPTANWAMR